MISNLLKTFIFRKVLAIIILYKIESKYTDQLIRESISFLSNHAFSIPKRKNQMSPSPPSPRFPTFAIPNSKDYK